MWLCDSELKVQSLADCGYLSPFHRTQTGCYPLCTPGVKRRVSETENLFLSSAQLKDLQSCPSYLFGPILLVIKSRDKFFLDAFVKLQKATGNFDLFVHPSVCPYAWNISAPNRRIVIKFSIWGFFENLSRKVMFHQNLRRITSTLRESVYTFMIMSRWILLRVRKVLDKSCRENSKHIFYVL